MVEIRLRRPHGSLPDLETTLRSQANAANMVDGDRPKDYLAGYLDWVNQTWRVLDGFLHRTQLEDLLHTRHYWVLRQMGGDEAWLTGQVRVELNARRDALVELADEARALVRRWDMASGVIVVPDTNMLLHTTELFDDLDWPKALQILGSVHLVLTMVVIDQIDNLKRSKQPVRSVARQTAKKIEYLLGDKPEGRVVIRDESPGPTTVEVLTDPLDHERLSDWDSEIITRAAYLRDLATVPVYVATWDNLMTFRASVADLRVVRPLPEYERPDETSSARKTDRAFAK